MTALHKPALGAILRRPDVIERRRRRLAEGRWHASMTRADWRMRYQVAVELGHLQASILHGGRRLDLAARDLRLLASRCEDAPATAAALEAA